MALVFTILGFVNVVGGNDLGSVTVVLLAVLAYSQIRSRGHIAAIATAQRSDPSSVFRTEFPDLDSRRASASSMLLIGVSVTSAVHGPSRTALRQMLRDGGSMRVLLLVPTDDALVRAASVHRPHGVTPDLLRRRIENTG